MSKTALLIWLGLLTAISILAAIALVRPARTSTPPRLLLTFDPAHVERLTVDDPQLPFLQQLSRQRPAGWSLTLTRRDDAERFTTWPLIDSRVRTALRALAEAPLRQAVSPEASLGPDPVTLTLQLASGASLRMEMASAPLGGRRLVRTQDGLLSLLDEAVAALFTNPGPREWRSRTALPETGAETSEVTITRHDQTLRLKRINGDWRILQPVRADADDALVRQLVDLVRAVRIEDFEDDPSPEDLQVAAMDHPVMTIAATREVRTVQPDGQVRIEPRTSLLVVGGKGDLEGRTRFARAGSSSPLLLIAVSDELERLEPDPLAYASRTAVTVQPANVGMLTLRDAKGEQGFRRDADGWVKLQADGSRSPTDAEAVEATLTFLSSRLASDVLLADDDAWSAPDSTITLYDFADGPLTTLALRRLDNGQLAVRAGDVELRYPASQLPALLAQTP